jgi:hypothetical protein
MLKLTRLAQADADKTVNDLESRMADLRLYRIR